MRGLSLMRGMLAFPGQGHEQGSFPGPHLSGISWFRGALKRLLGGYLCCCFFSRRRRRVMPPRIPWMTYSPMRKKKTQAMAVSLSLEWEGGEGQQDLAQLCPSPSPRTQDAHHPEIVLRLPLEMGQRLGWCSDFLSPPIISYPSALPGAVLGARHTEMSTMGLAGSSSQLSGRVALEWRNMSSSRERTRSLLSVSRAQPRLILMTEMFVE